MDTFQQEINGQRDLIKEQAENDPNSIYADTLREQKLTNILSQINPDNLLSDIEHRIRGEKKDPRTGMWIPIGKGDKQISELLVQNYISFLNAYLSQANSMSNYSSNEINNIMEVVCEYIRDDLSDNAEVYGLCKVKEIKKTLKTFRLEKVEDNGLIYMKEVPIEITITEKTGEETDYNEFNRIGHIICQTTFSVLKQAQGGLLAQRIFKSLRVNETNGGMSKDKSNNPLNFWK